MAEIVDFSKKLAHFIGKDTQFILNSHEILEGTINSIDQDFCSIVFTLNNGEILETIYPLSFRIHDNKVLFSYCLSDLNTTNQGKELIQTLSEESLECSDLYDKILTLRTK